MFYTTSCRGHKITVICGFTIVSHAQVLFQCKFITRLSLNIVWSCKAFFNTEALSNSL